MVMKEKILIVDDEREIADLVELYLQNEGYEICKFYNGRDALACAKREELALTPMEFKILWYLCEHQGKVVSSEELYEAVWGEKYLDSNNTVMAHIARIREKMHEQARNPKLIQTVWGVGYTIE